MGYPVQSANPRNCGKSVPKKILDYESKQPAGIIIQQGRTKLLNFGL
jgi:hypothetical protein